MPVPFRLAHVLGGLGTASTSGIGITGWQAWEEYNPTGDRRLRREGYFYGPIRFEANVLDVANQKGASSTKFFSKSYECFNRFFDVSDLSFDTDKIESAPSTEVSKPPSNGGSDYMGCTIMQLSHGPQNQGFVFMSETTIKNDKVGMVVWAGAKNVKFATDTAISSGDAFFRYYVLFLEKPSDKWSIKWGIIWDDYTVASYPGASSLKIISPDGSLNHNYSIQITSGQEQTSSGDWKYERYSGVWSSSGDETDGSGIFEEVKVAAVQSGTEYPEILGMSGEFKGNNNEGYKCEKRTYSANDKKWKEGNSGVDFTTNLNTWYAPFKDRKGKWENLENYCRKKSGARNIVGKEEIQFLKDFCYQKNSQ